MSSEKLQKFLATLGYGSRREIETWISAGRVVVNGEPAHLGQRVSAVDQIQLDGKKVGEKPAAAARVIIYNKPAGVICTRSDPEGRPTIFADLPPLRQGRWISVGRLDVQTTGLLLLTNDGELARHLELPATGWTRRYRVRVYGYVTQKRLDKLAKGIVVDGVVYGEIQAKLDSTKGHNSWVTMSFKEGKNREIRRVMEHLDLTVNRLIRTSYGPFMLGSLREGDIEEVTPKQLGELIGPKWVKD